MTIKSVGGRVRRQGHQDAVIRVLIARPRQRSLNFHVPFDSVLYLEEGESLRSLGVRGS